MNDNEVKEITDKIFKSIFGTIANLNIDEIKEKFAFDVVLPYEVKDIITGEITYADAKKNEKYITPTNLEKIDQTSGLMQNYIKFESIQSILDTWNRINFTVTERVYDSINVSKSDTIYRCEKVYGSTNCNDAKNIVYCDTCGNSEYMLACSRSFYSSFSIRVDDSANCSNSYCVQCSNKIVNSLFIDDCFDLYECIFCSHIASKKFCIANVQLEEREYYALKKKIIEWIFKS